MMTRQELTKATWELFNRRQAINRIACTCHWNTGFHADDCELGLAWDRAERCAEDALMDHDDDDTECGECGRQFDSRDLHDGLCRDCGLAEHRSNR